MNQSLLSSALLTDLYEFTMGGGYFHHRLQEPASFELFIRGLPASSILFNRRRARTGSPLFRKLSF